MVCYMCHISRPVLGSCRYHVRKVPLVDLDINVVGRAKGGYLHIVAVRSPFRHALQVALEDPINVGF